MDTQGGLPPAKNLISRQLGQGMAGDWQMAVTDPGIEFHRCGGEVGRIDLVVDIKYLVFSG